MLLASTSRPVNRVAASSLSRVAVPRSLSETYAVMSEISSPRPTFAAWWQTASAPWIALRTAAAITHVAALQLRAGIEVVGELRMDIGRERIEHTQLMPVGQQRVDDVRADEAGATGYEDPHRRGLYARGPGVLVTVGRSFQSRKALFSIS